MARLKLLTAIRQTCSMASGGGGRIYYLSSYGQALVLFGILMFGINCTAASASMLSPLDPMVGLACVESALVTKCGCERSMLPR
jgi:hypothetical protein